MSELLIEGEVMRQNMGKAIDAWWALSSHLRMQKAESSRTVRFRANPQITPAHKFGSSTVDFGRNGRFSPTF